MQPCRSLGCGRSPPLGMTTQRTGAAVVRLAQSRVIFSVYNGDTFKTQVKKIFPFVKIGYFKRDSIMSTEKRVSHFDPPSRIQRVNITHSVYKYRNCHQIFCYMICRHYLRSSSMILHSWYIFGSPPHQPQCQYDIVVLHHLPL